MSEPILKIEDLYVHFETYEGTAEVLDGVNLSVGMGEIESIVGETGCGKSLTVKTALGLVPNAKIPSGEIYFNGDKIYSSEIDRRDEFRGNEISLIMQDPMTSLNPVFTIGEQMMDVLRYQGKERVSITDFVKNKIRNEPELKEQVLQVLEDVQLSSPERVFNSYPHQLSGGMRQRVLIATTLLTEPSVLIADEPGTALDVMTEDKVLDIIDNIVEQYDTSALYITHDLGVAKRISDHISVMYAGQVVEYAPTESLFSNPSHPYTRGLLDSIPSLSKKMGTGIEGTVPDYVGIEPKCRFYSRCPYAVSGCAEISPNNENIDKDHTVGCHLFNNSSLDNQETSAADVEIDKPSWVLDRNNEPTVE